MGKANSRRDRRSFFLIPIITPALLQSEWCCQEIALFRQREATTLRRTDLIFPIHYLNVDDRDSSRPEDCHDAEVFRFLRSRQWTDFRALRHKNPESEDVARRIDSLADAICAALRRAERDPYAEEAREKVTAKAQDRVRADNDRRVRETEVKAETVQKGSEAEAIRAEEAKNSAADSLADEMASEALRRREATVERETEAMAERAREETEAWGAAAASTDKRLIEAFLKDWPRGQHSAAAKARLQELAKRPLTTAQLGVSAVTLILVGGISFIVFAMISDSTSIKISGPQMTIIVSVSVAIAGFMVWAIRYRGSRR
jgi:hypothetical protein